VPEVVRITSITTAAKSRRCDDLSTFLQTPLQQVGTELRIDIKLLQATALLLKPLHARYWRCIHAPNLLRHL
jgi:hypothetical protein